MTTDPPAQPASSQLPTPAFPDGPPLWPRPDERVRVALDAAVADGSWGRYHGPHGERLVAALSSLLGVPHVSLCASGTIAVELALRGLQVGTGDEVVLAAYDFPGNFRAIEAVGARPVLVDIDPRTWCLQPEGLAAAFGPATRAMIVSHLHGGLAPMSRLRDLADSRGVAIVEDACQSPGAIVEGRPAGTWGDVGVFSFGGSKLLTAGRGGALCTCRPEIHQRVKVYAERGNDAFPLSELQAAVLLPQVQSLAEDNRRRAANVARLLSQCGDLSGLRAAPVFGPDSPDSQPAYYKVAWLLGDGSDAGSEALAARRERLLGKLQAEGIAIDAGFRGFANRSDRRCRRVGTLEHARRAAAGTLILHHPILLAGPDQMDLLAAAIVRHAAPTAT